MKFEKSCGAVVIDNGCVLVVRHRAGHVDFPKGHVESDETEEETAIREVKEETNIDIEILGNRTSIHYYPKGNIDKEVVYFKAKRIGGDIIPQLEEVQEVKWVPIEEVNDILTFDVAKDVLAGMLKEDL